MAIICKANICGAYVAFYVRLELRAMGELIQRGKREGKREATLLL